MASGHGRRIGGDGHGASDAPWPSAIPDGHEQAMAHAMDALLAAGGATVRRGFERIESRRLHVLEAGQGETMLLLHGAGGGAANWFALLEPLSARFRVVAPDLPGFGFSDLLPLHPPLGDAVAHALTRWLDARGAPTLHVVGTSLGGLIALRLAQRLGPRLRSMTLIDSAGLGRSLPLAVRLATLPPLRALAGSTSRLGLTLFFHTFLTSSAVPVQRRRALLDYMAACAAAGGGDTLVANLAEFASAQGQREVLSDDELRSIDTRTLIVWGARDRFLPIRHGRRAAALLPESRFVPLTGIGHSPNWELPDRVARDVIAFAEATT